MMVYKKFKNVFSSIVLFMTIQIHNGADGKEIKCSDLPKGWFDSPDDTIVLKGKYISFIL